MTDCCSGWLAQGSSNRDDGPYCRRRSPRKSRRGTRMEATMMRSVDCILVIVVVLCFDVEVDVRQAVTSRCRQGRLSPAIG